MNPLISVMLVDDEPLALDNVYEMVPWADNGFQVVAKANSGRMALQLFEELQPQIVITDISMSPMDGLELGRLVVQRAPKTRLIFLTAYRDFDYARQALEMRAAHYLLKHEISRNRLLEQLKLLKTDLAAEAAEEEGHEQALHILLKDMLAGKYSAPPGNQESQLHRLVTELQQGQPVLLYFELEPVILLDGSRRNQRWPASVRKSVMEDILLQSTEIEDIHMLEMDEGGYVALLKLCSSSSLLLQHYNLRQIASHMLTCLEAHYECALPRIIISAGSSAELPGRRYAAMREAYDYSLFLPPGAVFLAPKHWLEDLLAVPSKGNLTNPYAKKKSGTRMEDYRTISSDYLFGSRMLDEGSRGAADADSLLANSQMSNVLCSFFSGNGEKFKLYIGNLETKQPAETAGCLN